MDLFEYQSYQNRYSDLTNLNQKELWKHYINHGLSENRSICSSHFNPNSKEIVLFTNARDELNIKEWYIHHLLLGFDCVYIFDHLSTNPITVADSRVDVIRINKEGKIKDELIDFAIKIARSIKAKWMLYLDADEFLVLKQNNIQEFINSHPDNTSLIGIHWLMFGTSDFITTPPGLLIENYTKCDLKLNKGVKTLAKVNDILSKFTPHNYRIDIKNIRYINRIKNNNNLAFYETNLNYQNVDAYIAHYIYQSEETFKLRKLNRPDDHRGNFRFHVINNLHDQFNEVENNDLNKYVLKIKNEL